VSKKKKGKLIFQAIEFAVKAHTNHFRKGTNIPYIVHPLGVGKILIEHGFSEDVIAAGILHDTIEDTPVTLKDIKKYFGGNIRRIVEGASEPDKSDTWENRKRHTIEYLKTAPLDVRLVSCADKLDNIRAIREDYAKLGEKLWSRFNRPKKDQRWYYRSLAHAFLYSNKTKSGKKLFKDFASAVNNFFT